PLARNVDEWDRHGIETSSVLIHRQTVIIGEGAASTGQPSGTGPATAHTRQGSMLEAADSDFGARHAFLACHGRLPPVANRGDEGLEPGSQRPRRAHPAVGHGTI